VTLSTKNIKTSPSQRLVLQSLADGKKWDAHISGRSTYGGATATMYALTKHGLIKAGKIAEAGLQALAPESTEDGA
jgi:hypothetical protein